MCVSMRWEQGNVNGRRIGRCSQPHDGSAVLQNGPAVCRTRLTGLPVECYIGENRIDVTRVPRFPRDSPGASGIRATTSFSFILQYNVFVHRASSSFCRLRL